MSQLVLILILGGITLLAIAVVPGFWLWWPSRADPACRSDLGVNLLTGALVAFAVFALQVVVQNSLDRLEDDRRQQAEQQNLLLQVGLRKDLTGIDLDGEDLRSAYLYGKTLRRASLKDAHMEEARLSRAHVYRTDLTKAHLWHAQLDGVIAWPWWRRRARHEFPTVVFDKADLRGRANLSFASLVDASFIESRLQSANFRETHLEGAILERAHLSGANLENATLRDADLQGADLTGTDLGVLRNGGLDGADVSGVKYDYRTNWPKRWPKTNPPTRRPKKRCEIGAICRIRP
jgi:uncharacterized protein YjbI with pentapeptide repeats